MGHLCCFLFLFLCFLSWFLLCAVPKGCDVSSLFLICCHHPSHLSHETVLQAELGLLVGFLLLRELNSQKMELQILVPDPLPSDH